MSEHRRLSILYLDDEHLCLEVFSEMCGDSYEVTTAMSAGEARRALREKSFDVVVSDQSMPDVRGSSFLREVARAQPGSYRVLLTGTACIGEVLGDISVINCFMTKPWTIDDVERMLARAGAWLSSAGEFDCESFIGKAR